MTSTQYNKHQHRHNFAVWTAARATQRAFTNTDILKSALESSDIRRFIERPCGRSKFDDYHRMWCSQIREYLQSKKVANATYGRAAKLVNVYLKSMVVLPDLESEEAAYIHPPIDRILLQNVARDPTVRGDHSKLLRNTSWTKLNESQCFNLIQVLRHINGDKPFWKLEEHWHVTTMNLSS